MILRVALVYDRVNKFGGAERVLLALHKIWPNAPLYTSVYDQKGAPWASDFNVIPSFLQKIKFLKTRHEFIPILMPYVFESFDFSAFDVVISITSAEAKGIITKPETMHLCFMLTPTRYLWSSKKLYLKNPQFGFLNPVIKPVMKPMLESLRNWDLVAASRPDNYVSISQTVRQRIKKYYKKEAEVIYPPVDTDFFRPLDNKTCQGPAFTSKITSKIKYVKAGPLHKQYDNKNRYFLVVSRLVKYKRVDIIIRAFNKLGLALKIIGDGAERHKLQKLAKSNIEFLGQRLTDNKLLSYYQNCVCLVFAGREDFGLVSLEAQACGKPVVAYSRGGLGETVINGKTGILFDKQSSQALIKAIKLFKNNKYSRKECRNNALNYSQEKFIQNFKSYVEDKWMKYQAKLK